jgi:hypothetical protein
METFHIVWIEGFELPQTLILHCFSFLFVINYYNKQLEYQNYHLWNWNWPLYCNKPLVVMMLHIAPNWWFNWKTHKHFVNIYALKILSPKFYTKCMEGGWEWCKVQLRHCKLKSICWHDKVMLNECKFEINIISMFSQFDVSKNKFSWVLKMFFSSSQNIHFRFWLGLD